MRVSVNGNDLDLPEGARVTDMLSVLGLETKPCAVEVNRALVAKREHTVRQLAEGDKVEVVTLVGGG